jgi:hypothetical protein
MPANSLLYIASCRELNAPPFLVLKHFINAWNKFETFVGWNLCDWAEDLPANANT